MRNGPPKTHLHVDLLYKGESIGSMYTAQPAAFTFQPGNFDTEIAIIDERRVWVTISTIEQDKDRYEWVIRGSLDTHHYVKSQDDLPALFAHLEWREWQIALNSSYSDIAAMMTTS